MKALFNDAKFLKIKQLRELWEMTIGWETANKYEILSEEGAPLGYAAERSKGIFDSLIKNFLKAHRPMTIDIWDQDRNHILIGKRPFYFFFSDMSVSMANGSSDTGERVGDIKTRFGILKRKYDLLDGRGRLFARIESPRWRLWTFFIKDQRDEDAGKISKKWGGALTEIFSDSDTFGIDLSKRAWSDKEKALLLFSALSIDLDFFEENSSSAIDLFD